MSGRILPYLLSTILLITPTSTTADVVETIPVANVVEEVVQAPQPTKVSLGVYKLSAYCRENYPHICNNGNSSTTATGTVPTAGRTIAVDPKVIPYGSKVIINGHEYIAEDCGGAIKGKRIDIVFNTHREALNFGIQYAEVFLVVEDK